MGFSLGPTVNQWVLHEMRNRALSMRLRHVTSASSKQHIYHPLLSPYWISCHNRPVFKMMSRSVFANTTSISFVLLLLAVVFSPQHISDRLPPHLRDTHQSFQKYLSHALRSETSEDQNPNYQVRLFSRDPLILYVDNFLTPFEVDHLLKVRLVSRSTCNTCSIVRADQIYTTVKGATKSPKCFPKMIITSTMIGSHSYHSSNEMQSTLGSLAGP